MVEMGGEVGPLSERNRRRMRERKKATNPSDDCVLA